MNLLKYFASALVFSMLLSTSYSQLNYQTKKYPVSNYIYWPDKGVILYGEAPDGRTLLKECTMVNEEPKAQWNKTIMPLVDDPDAVYSKSSDYIYFLDKITADIGKISFNQFHKAGTLRKKNIGLNTAFFKLGSNIDLNDLSIAAAGTTKHFLVVLFEYYESSTSEYKYAVALIKHVTFKMELFWVPEMVVTKNELNRGFKGSLRLLGDINGNMILSQPEATEKFVGKNHFSFNEDGEFMKRKQLQWPEKGKYPLMSYDIDLAKGNILSSHLAIDLGSNPGMSHQGTEKIIGDHKYVCGFYGMERPEGKNPDRSGVYVVKYTGSGDLVWKKFVTFKVNQLENKDLISKNSVLGQSLVLEDGNLSFSYGHDDRLYNMIISDKSGSVTKETEKIQGLTLEDLKEKKYHIMLNRTGSTVDYSFNVQKMNGKWYKSKPTEKEEAVFTAVD